MPTITYDVPPVVLVSLVARNIGTALRIADDLYVVATRDVGAAESLLVNLSDGSASIFPHSTMVEAATLDTIGVSIG